MARDQKSNITTATSKYILNTRSYLKLIAKIKLNRNDQQSIKVLLGWTSPPSPIHKSQLLRNSKQEQYVQDPNKSECQSFDMTSNIYHLTILLLVA